MDTIFDEQENLVLDALKSETLPALLTAGLVSNFESIVPLTALTLSTQPLVGNMRKVYTQAINDNIAEGYGSEVTEDVANAAVSEHLSKVNSFNKTTQNEVASALGAASVATSEDGGDIDIAMKLLLATTLVKAVFSKLRASRKALIVDAAVYGAYNQGLYDSVEARPDRGVSINKQWVSIKDEKVRMSHRQLHGDSVPVGSPFYVQGVPIRFPKDPLAPAGLTINCRCILKFTR